MSFDFTKDPAVVNVPLSKRGNIDAQIDRYKAEQEKARRAADAAHRANKSQLIAEARRRFDAAPDSAFAAMAERHGKTAKQVRASLKSYVRARPQWIIDLLAGEK
ncbi:hypothetical protein ABB25_00965 [Stenotrophomonas koreensis]|uniref:Uncharacterized protein n=1 Tax=Stenotrophomonas koreensis TaxID=266128 RepID=A0A0R0BTJ9_9GAMM|nr:hypothetical protein [Stenotrophomonas koreensis]KRG60796.1 hypothetical protein ABB25_00965 [Stenotrophomonas koreensis]